MSGDEIARLSYLVLLLVAVGGWFIAEARGNMGKSVRQAMVWGFLFLGLIAAYGLWGDIRNEVAPRQALSQSGVIEVPAHFDGHYYLTLRLDGVDVDFVVDTGATDVVLSQSDAQRVGLKPALLDYSDVAQSANGLVRSAPVIIEEVALEGIVDQNVAVSVNEGEMDISLLGMGYLRYFDRIEITNDTMILTR